MAWYDWLGIILGLAFGFALGWTGRGEYEEVRRLREHEEMRRSKK